LSLLFLGGEIIVALGCVAFLTYFYRFSRDLPKPELIADGKGPTATSIWSQDGVMLGQLDVENRQPVPLDKIPKVVQDATIAIEDHRFYEHQGVDVMGVMRAAWVDIRGGATRQGASTLTQQLVRNVSTFGVSREKNMSRKVREMLTAVRLEQYYSKKEILQLYLNNAYYGAGSYGIEAASQTYFGKPAVNLKLSEAALLAGLPQRPRSYTPFEHKKDAVKRRDEVLDSMQKWGYISAQECADAKAEKPKIMAAPKRRDYDFKAPYFTRYVLREMIKKYGRDFVESGVRIDTTLDYKMQQAAEKALADGIERNRRLGANDGCLVSIDPATGYIRAMVGGTDFNKSQYNIVTQGKRQPGSTFKIFDYACAFETENYTLRNGFVDKPIPYPGDPKHRVVHNEYDESSGRWTSFKDAIKYSKNTIAVQLAQEVGMQNINELAHKMGITTELSPYLPTAIGASAVRPLDLCSAYSIVPNHGNRCQPMCVTRITNAAGELVDPSEFQPHVDQNVLKPSTVQQLDEAFGAVVSGGTGVPARGNTATGVVENAHGKTGTTDEFRDVWFAGYTPELTTVVWVGSVSRDARGRTSYRSMHGATGGHTCGQIWHDFMVQAVPLQRTFQAANPGLADPDNIATENSAKSGVKKDSKKTPARSDQPQTSPDPNAPDPNNPDGVPADPGAGDPGSAGTEVGDGANKAGQVTAPATTVTGGTPTVPTATPQPNVRPQDEEMISVKVCTDTGDLVNGSWCPSYTLSRVTRAAALRMHKCKIHHAPPGERE
jgi:penicillin-binding protein 1A